MIYPSLPDMWEALNCSDLPSDWPQWRQAFEIFIVAAFNEELGDRQKLAVFLHCLGRNGRDLINGWFPELKSFNSVPAKMVTFAQVWNDLNAHCRLLIDQASAEAVKVEEESSEAQESPIVESNCSGGAALKGAPENADDQAPTNKGNDAAVGLESDCSVGERATKELSSAIVIVEGNGCGGEAKKEVPVEVTGEDPKVTQKEIPKELTIVEKAAALFRPFQQIYANRRRISNITKYYRSTLLPSDYRPSYYKNYAVSLQDFLPSHKFLEAHQAISWLSSSGLQLIIDPETLRKYPLETNTGLYSDHGKRVKWVQIVGCAANQFLRLLCLMPVIEELSLSFVELPNDTVFKSFPKHVKKLIVSHCTISSSILENLLRVWSPELEHLHLENIDCGKSCPLNISGRFSVLTSLVVLDMSASYENGIFTALQNFQPGNTLPASFKWQYSPKLTSITIYEFDSTVFSILSRLSHLEKLQILIPVESKFAESIIALNVKTIEGMLL